MTSVERPQLAHAAMTERTPFKRMLASVIGSTVDAVRESNGMAARAAEPAASSVPILSRQQARRAAYDADLKRLDLEERRGVLVRVAKVEDALVAAGEKIVRIIDQLPMDADDLATPSPPWPPFPPVAAALFRGAVIGCALPALAETDSPSPPGMPLSPENTPSAPAAPSSPWTVTISARAQAALAVITASDTAPVINARIKIER